MNLVEPSENLQTALNFTKGRLLCHRASISSLRCRDQGREKRETRSSYCWEVEGREGSVRQYSKRKREENEGDRDTVRRWIRSRESWRAQNCAREEMTGVEEGGGGFVLFSLLSLSLCWRVSQEQQRLLSSQNEDALNPALLVSAEANSTDSRRWLRHTEGHKGTLTRRQKQADKFTERYTHITWPGMRTVHTTRVWHTVYGLHNA